MEGNTKNGLVIQREYQGEEWKEWINGRCEEIRIRPSWIYSRN